MSPPALIMRGVIKSYGKVRALDGLDLEVPAGSLCGLVGPNGAGKTTTFGIAGGAIRASGGEVDLLGMGPFDPAVHAGRVTLLPQDCELNPYTSVRQLLVFYGRLQGLSAGEASREADRMLDAVDLADRGGSRVNQLSHGMRRRVAVAQALLGDPALVLLDEPTSGLDPHLVVRMRELFAAQRGRRTMIISSHQLSELEAVCDHVIFMEKGRAVRAGALAEVTGRGTEVRVFFAHVGEITQAAEVARAAVTGGEARATANYLLVRAPEGWDVARLNAALLPALIQAGHPVEEVRRGSSLEQTYMEARAEAGADKSFNIK